MTVGKFLRDPLIHFLVVGLGVYFLLSAGENQVARDGIIVTEKVLLDHIQFRTKSFNEDLARSRLAEMSAAGIRSLIDDVWREEALYREATELGLDRGDYVIRQRLVGKMAFLTQGAGSEISPGSDALRKFHDQNQQDYTEPATITFTHIFISGEGKPGPLPGAEAEALLEKLTRENVSYETAQRWGDRFLFRTNYVDQGYAVIEAEFGKPAARQIFSATSPVESWFGPVLSEYGAHVIFIVARSPARSPAFEEIQEQLVTDYGRARAFELQSAMEGAIISDYELKIAADVEALINDRAKLSPEAPGPK